MFVTKFSRIFVVIFFTDFGNLTNSFRSQLARGHTPFSTSENWKEIVLNEV
jgi:hypothetical protein